MNTKGFFSGIAFTCLASLGASAADKPVSSVKTKVVAELRGQDNAFALMMESYRQLQILMIESDYEKGIALAKQIPDEKERQRILVMVQQEHDMRITKLKQTIQGFDSAYGTSRKDLEKKAGGETVTQITPAEAGDQLRQFRAFTPQEFKMENRPSHLLPAGARMLYDDKRY